MEQLNYHKLLNLQKRFSKYESSESSIIICNAIAQALEIEKAKSEKADKERRFAYQTSTVECPYCGNEFRRKSLYYHKNVCKSIDN
jgi:hypothetical protein